MNAPVSLHLALRDAPVDADAVAVFVFADVRPLGGLAGRIDWLLCGSLSRLLLDGRITGSIGEIALLTTERKLAAQKLFLVGLGSVREYSIDIMRSAVKSISQNILAVGSSRLALEYVHPSGCEFRDAVRHIREAVAEGTARRSLAVSLVANDHASFHELSRSVS